MIILRLFTWGRVPAPFSLPSLQVILSLYHSIFHTINRRRNTPLKCVRSKKEKEKEEKKNEEENKKGCLKEN